MRIAIVVFVVLGCSNATDGPREERLDAREDSDTAEAADVPGAGDGEDAPEVDVAGSEAGGSEDAPDVHEVPPACDDGDPCTDDSSSGDVCIHKLNQEPCDDGSVCTSEDRCANDVCSGKADVFCKDDGDPCTVEACDPVAGCVVAETLGDAECACASACTDPRAKCVAAVCTFVNSDGPVTCPAGVPCRVEEAQKGAIDCGLASFCEVVCGADGGGGRCRGGITCGPGPCKIVCGGGGGGSNCSGKMDCGESCACEVACLNGCDATPVCAAGCAVDEKTCTADGACNACE